VRKVIIQHVISTIIGEKYINARKVARKLRRRGIEVSTKTIGYILKLLREKGILEVYKDRRGRFKIYRVL